MCLTDVIARQHAGNGGGYVGDCNHAPVLPCHVHERQLPFAGTAAGREKNRKYAVNLGLVDHTELRQRNYLQFLCLKTVVWSGVPKFAAYFRSAIAEVREKPRFADQTTVLRLRDLRFCCRKLGCARRFSVFPRTSACRAFREQFAMLRSNVPGRNSVKNTAILLLSTVSGSSDGAQLPLHERH